jgi:hypothetical protein
MLLYILKLEKLIGGFFLQVLADFAQEFGLGLVDEPIAKVLCI